MSETLREHDPDCLQKATGSVLRALRDEQGWSLDEASTHTNQPGSTGRGISAAWLSKIECGKKKLTPKVRAVLLELYGTDLATFEGRVREELERPPAEARLIVRPLSPPDTTTFGRDEAITEVTALLLAGEERCPRIVTLAGDGGSGKTRLAREVAWRLSQDPFFAGRVWWVPLETVTDRLLMAEALRDTLGLPQGAADPLGQVVRALASQPALIVLDNFERLVEAAAEDIQHLMACTDGLKLLVTSRRRLDLELERAYPILRLSVPEPVASVQELQSNPSVQMFMDRAGAKGVSILVSQANAGVLAHMCRCLEGIPQWIKLAAGRSDLLSPEQIAHSWSESRSLFTSNWRGDPERHQSIDAGIEWSCTLLSPETRSFLERLSVFRGPWTLRAAGAVGKAADPGKPLGELRCCYLIEPTAEAREGGLISDETRFEMLEPVRDYLHACLSQEERAAARNRHAEYYLDQATAAELHLEGSRKAEWLDQLDADVGNHRAALEWFQESGARESGLRLAGVLWWFWYGRCYWREGRKWLESFLDAPGEATAAAEARARTGAGTLAWAQDEYSLAEQHLTRAVELHRETADRNSLAWCLGILGNVARSQYRLPEARRQLEESLCIYQDLGDWRGAVSAQHNLAEVLRWEGDYQGAADLVWSSYRVAHELKNTRDIAFCLVYAGRLVAFAEHQHERGRAFLDEARQRFADLKDPWGLSYPLLNLGVLQHLQGDLTGALSLCREALSLRRDVGDRRGVAECLEQLGTLATANGQTAVAAQLYGAAAALRQRLGTRRPDCELTTYDRDLATLRHALGEPAFSAAWELGRNSTVEQVVGFALGVEISA